MHEKTFVDLFIYFFFEEAQTRRPADHVLVFLASSSNWNQTIYF